MVRLFPGSDIMKFRRRLGKQSAMLVARRIPGVLCDKYVRDSHVRMRLSQERLCFCGVPSGAHAVFVVLTVVEATDVEPLLNER